MCFVFKLTVWKSSLINISTDPKTLLKHRQVKHYGYEFLYGANNVDANSPLDEKIPKTCDVIWEKLKKNCVEGLNEKQADQLTVNKYEPGQGKFSWPK